MNTLIHTRYSVHFLIAPKRDRQQILVYKVLIRALLPSGWPRKYINNNNAAAVGSMTDPEIPPDSDVERMCAEDTAVFPRV